MPLEWNIRGRNFKIDRILLAFVCFFLATVALLTPVWSANNIESSLGGLLLCIGVIELIDAFKRPDRTSKISAQASGTLSLLMGVLLINAILFQSRALYVFVISIFVIDSIRYFLRFVNTGPCIDQYFNID